MSQPAALNQDQIDYWNGEAGASWTRNQERVDRFLAPITAKVLDAAKPAKGEAILDIGCGCGETTLALAEAAGPAGKVTGVDISAPMLERARERAAAKGLAPEFIKADAASYDFTPESFDLVFSRFGVMFFDEPAAAFANIRKAMKPGGRLSFVCWREAKENEWVFRPLVAALPHITPPEPPAPGAPGPFAFADEGHVRGLLEEAGFDKVHLDPLDLDLIMAEGGADMLDQSINFVLEIGPVARALKSESEAVTEKVIGAVREELAKFETPKGLVLKGACWIVSARP